MIDDLIESAEFHAAQEKTDRDEWTRNELIESELQPTRYDLMAFLQRSTEFQKHLRIFGISLIEGLCLCRSIELCIERPAHKATH